MALKNKYISVLYMCTVNYCRCDDFIVCLEWDIDNHQRYTIKSVYNVPNKMYINDEELKWEISVYLSEDSIDSLIYTQYRERIYYEIIGSLILEQKIEYTGPLFQYHPGKMDTIIFYMNYINSKETKAIFIYDCKSTLSRINDTFMGYSRINKFKDRIEFYVSKKVLVFTKNGEFVGYHEKSDSEDDSDYE